MVPKSSLFSALLLICVVAAGSFSPLGARMGCQENRYDLSWAGAILSEGEGTFTVVTATLTAPTLAGNNGVGGAWVGIDGVSCQNAALQAGIGFNLTDGEPSYSAWYEWYPDGISTFSDVTVAAGDLITVTVMATSATSGLAIIENLTNGQSATQDITSTSALCQQDAEWIVQDPQMDGGGLAPLVDFGNVVFVDVIASGTSGTLTPSNANLLLNIMQDGKVLTSVSASESSLVVEYGSN